MKIGKIKAKLLKTVVSSARALAEETAFFFDVNGLLVNCMDESHSCMVSIAIEPEAFGSYDLDDDATEKIGVELGRLSNGLSVMNDDEDVLMSLGEGKQDGKFILKSKTATLSCNKIDTATMEDPQMPNLPLDEYCQMKIESGEIQKAIKALSKVGDTKLGDGQLIRFHFNAGVLEMKVKTDYEELVLRPAIETRSKPMDSAEATYDREFMVDLMKALTEGTVKISFSDKKPIVLQSSFADGNGDLAMFAAPRIVEELE
jgi:DNA polymerase III sliding clamp (beta) subunit (PCNA family)